MVGILAQAAARSVLVHSRREGHRLMSAAETGTGVSFGAWLTHLRGRERIADVVRRVGHQITQQHLSRLEGQERAGQLEYKTLLVLAEAYWEGNYVSRETAFWDLWERAGYPLPVGYAAGLSRLADDPQFFDALRRLLDAIGTLPAAQVDRLATAIRGEEGGPEENAGD